MRDLESVPERMDDGTRFLHFSRQPRFLLGRDGLWHTNSVWPAGEEGMRNTNGLQRICGRADTRRIAGVIGVPDLTVRRRNLPRIVSLFSGAGGLDLGFKEAGFNISVAFDSDEVAVRTHRKNFPRTKSVVADLTELQPPGVLAEVKTKIANKHRIGVIGGPPCQGFSRANVSAQASDTRNKLPELYMEVVRELQRAYTVEFIVFENVLGIRDKKHADTYKALIEGITNLGFDVFEEDLCAADFGVAQNRRRIIIAGMRSGQGYPKIRPRKRKGLETVRETIGSLDSPAFFKHGLPAKDIPVHPNHWTMQPRSYRFTSSNALRSDGRSFKRLSWDEASPTIAFGHREIHVHPTGRRRLSIYEAMLLQGFPNEFVLCGNLSEQVVQVSNAVPPPLARAVALAVKRVLIERQHGKVAST